MGSDEFLKEHMTLDGFYGRRSFITGQLVAVCFKGLSLIRNCPETSRFSLISLFKSENELQ
jgi:hypothetical protein